jgi:5-methylthioadenosine/S-adenosylhomocysteine deaminase
VSKSGAFYHVRALDVLHHSRPKRKTAAAAASRYNPPMSKTSCDLIIDAAWILPVAPVNSVLHAASIAVAAGRIVKLGDREHVHADYAAAEVLSLPQHALLPGLVNAHGHAAMSLFRGFAEDAPLESWLTEQIWPTEARLVDADFVRDGARLALAEMIHSGTTCFADMYFFPEITAQEAGLAGVRGQIAFPVIEFPNAWSANSAEGFHKGLALHDAYRQDERIQIAFGPHASYSVSEQDLQKILMYSEELDANIQIHLHETAQEVAEARERVGTSWVHYLHERQLLGPHLQAVHATQLDAEEIALLAENNVQVVHCPYSNLKLASGTCPTTALLDSGINVGLGTDGAASNNGLDVLLEARLASLLAKQHNADATALPATQALEMATLGGARVLGLEAEIGSLEPGKAADMVAVDLSAPKFQPLFDPIAQLIHTTSGSAVTHAWVAGQCLLDDGQLTTLDEDHVLRAAREWRDRILA